MSYETKSQHNRNLTKGVARLLAAIFTVSFVVVGIATGPAAANDSPAWLRHLNEVRERAGVADVSLNPQWDAGTSQHSCYMAQNGLGQNEDPSAPGYSLAGAEAGTSSAVAADVSDAVGLIDRWLSDPSHSVELLRSDWTETSLGICDGFATLDVSRGLGDAPPSDTVVYPPRNSTQAAASVVDTDRPSAVCGDDAATGLPLTVQFPEPIASAGEVDAEIVSDGATDAPCVITADTPGLPDGWTLRANELVVLPGTVMNEGRHTVTVSAGTQVVTWSFDVTATSNTADSATVSEPPVTATPEPAEEAIPAATDPAATNPATTDPAATDPAAIEDEPAVDPDGTGEPATSTDVGGEGAVEPTPLPTGVELTNDDTNESFGAASDSISSATSNSDWLAHLNEIRRQSGLGRVSVNFSWNYGTNRHSCYMLANGITHAEIPGRPCYTREGEEAGKNSVVAVAGSATTENQFIDLWMTAPFHAILMLRPGLNQTSLGIHRDRGLAGATLDVLRGSSGATPSRTVVFPGNNQVTNLNRFYAESPDPRLPCGYSGRSVGLPLIVQFPKPVFEGYGVVNARITGPLPNGFPGPISNCELYKNKPNLSTTYSQFLGPNDLIIMPSQVLRDGRHTVTVTAGRQSYTWSFVVRTAEARATCANKTVTMMGTDGNDIIRGTSGDDVIYGGRGDDIIYGEGGNDTICGAEGDDKIDGGYGNDILYGNDGRDKIDGGGNDDFISGDAGTDWLFGRAGNDRVFGGADNDVVGGDSLVSPNDPFARWGDGNDQLDGGDGQDLTIGGGGNDTLKGGNGPDTLHGGPGYDRGDGGGNNDACDTESKTSCELPPPNCSFC